MITFRTSTTAIIAIAAAIAALVCALQYLPPWFFEPENHSSPAPTSIMTTSESHGVQNVARPDPAISNISSPGGQISFSTETWNIQDFDLSFALEVPILLPSDLYTYRLSFITDESMAQHQVSLSDAKLIASRLGFNESPLLVKSGELLRGFYSTHSRWFVGDPGYGMPFLDVDMSTGYFDYSSGTPCERSKSEISTEEAQNKAIKFVRDRNLVNIQTVAISVLGPRELNETFRNCFVIFFTNNLPIDNKEIKNQFDLYSTQEVSLPPSYNSRGFPHDGLSVSIDPSSGAIAYIRSEYLKLTPIERFPTYSLEEITRLLKSESEIVSFEDIDIKKPRSKSPKGTIHAIVKFISPYYIEDDTQDSVAGRIGSVLEPFYYAIALVPIDATTSPYSSIRHLSIRVPVKK